MIPLRDPRPRWDRDLDIWSLELEEHWADVWNQLEDDLNLGVRAGDILLAAQQMLQAVEEINTFSGSEEEQGSDLEDEVFITPEVTPPGVQQDGFREFAALARNLETAAQVNTTRVVDLLRLPKIPVTVEEDGATGARPDVQLCRSTRDKKQTDFYQ